MNVDDNLRMKKCIHCLANWVWLSAFFNKTLLHFMNSTQLIYRTGHLLPLIQWG